MFGERKEGPLNITIKYPTLNTSWVYFYPQKSYTTFSFIKNGSYEIMNNRYGSKNYGKSYHGKIRIVSTEFPFSLSLNDDISFYSMKIKNDTEPCPIIVNLENNLNKDLMKSISIQEYNYNLRKLEFLFLSENDKEFRLVQNDLIYFKKGVKYKMKLVFNLFGDDCVMAFLDIKDYNSSLISIGDFSYGKKTYKNVETAFLKVPSFENISIKRYPHNYFGAYYALCTKEDLNDFPYNIHYLDFWHDYLKISNFILKFL